MRATAEVVVPEVWSSTRTAHRHPFRTRGPAAAVSEVERVFRTLPTAPAEPARVTDFALTAHGDAGFVVTEAGQVLSEGPLAECLESVQWALNRLVVTGAAPDETVLHAACVMSGDLVLLLPADSGRGKSTLAAGLVRRGWSYCTDEAVVVTPDGVATPYPKPLTVDQGAWWLFPEATAGLRSAESCLVPAADLGGDLGAGGQVGLVVSPHYVVGAPTQLETLTPGRLTLMLATSTFAFNDDGARHLPLLANIARAVPGHGLLTGDLEAALDAVEGLAAQMGEA